MPGLWSLFSLIVRLENGNLLPVEPGHWQVLDWNRQCSAFGAWSKPDSKGWKMWQSPHKHTSPYLHCTVNSSALWNAHTNILHCIAQMWKSRAQHFLHSVIFCCNTEDISETCSSTQNVMQCILNETLLWCTALIVCWNFWPLLHTVNCQYA